MSVDLSYLEKMAGGDVATKKAMLELLHNELSEKIPQIPRLLKSRDWDAIHRFSHHLKSTVVFSGNKTLIRANQELLDMMEDRKHNPPKNPDPARADQLARVISTQGQRVQREVAQILKKL
ncbi:MAG: hypothetical protein D6772_03145 [Bacteroidetes bacterium]|nr:MAG: hypothetical protein D6772_03145 [Bacteroidota bacterium]